MVLLSGCLALGLAGGVSRQPVDSHIAGQTIVRLNRAAFQRHGRAALFSGHRVLGRIESLGALLVAAEPSQVPVRTPGITGVERNHKAQLCFTPNDPMFNQQWHLPKVNAPIAWDLGRGSVNTPIAVVDSGILYTHPDLAAVYQPGGWDFVNNDNDPLDDMGHGTLVAGVASATTNNALGVAGLGFGCPLVAIKVVNAGGGATVFDIAQGIEYAVNSTNARVINVSLGTTVFNQTLDDACELALDAGVVVVGAAGNNNSSNNFYPASKPGVIGVGASTPTDARWAQSNFSSGWVDVAAPGEGILSTNINPQYGSISGTSMSAPLVSGLAGLLYNQLGAGRSKAKAELVRSAVYAGASDVALWTTFGRVDARDSLRFVKSVNPLSFGWAPYSHDAGGGVKCAADGNGNVFVAHSQGIGNATNVRVAKYSSVGALVWQRSLNGFNYKDSPAEIVCDSSGNLFVAASADRADGTSDMMVGKYGPTGVLLWKKTFDGPGRKTDRAKAVSLNGDTLVVAGHTHQADNATRSALLWALSATNGATIASKTYNHTASFGDDAWDVSARNDGKFYVGLASPVPTQQNNAVVLLYDPGPNSLTLLGAYNGPLNSDDFPISVRTADNGDAFVAGFSDNHTSFVLRVRATGGFAFARRTSGQLSAMVLDSTGAPVWTGSLVLGFGNRAFLTRKIDPLTGDVLWSRRIGGFGKTIDQVYDDTAVALVQSGGSIVVTGWTSSTTTLNTMTLWLNAATGQLLRVARYDAGGAQDFPTAVAVSTASKNVFVGCLTDQASGAQARLLRYAP